MDRLGSAIDKRTGKEKKGVRNVCLRCIKIWQVYIIIDGVNLCPKCKTELTD